MTTLMNTLYNFQSPLKRGGSSAGVLVPGPTAGAAFQSPLKRGGSSAIVAASTKGKSQRVSIPSQAGRFLCDNPFLNYWDTHGGRFNPLSSGAVPLRVFSTKPP